MKRRPQFVPPAAYKVMPDSPRSNNIRSKRPPKAWLKKHRPQDTKPIPRSKFRRVLRKIFNAWTLSIAGILIVSAFLTATYFWFDFSGTIDRKLLSGEVFTPNAGIYSAPKTLRKGEKISRDELIAYLKSAGYIERSDKADQSRSRYSIDGDNFGIEPGASAMIDGKKIGRAHV